MGIFEDYWDSPVQNEDPEAELRRKRRRDALYGGSELTTGGEQDEPHPSYQPDTYEPPQPNYPSPRVITYSAPIEEPPEETIARQDQQRDIARRINETRLTQQAVGMQQLAGQTPVTEPQAPEPGIFEKFWNAAGEFGSTWKEGAQAIEGDYPVLEQIVRPGEIDPECVVTPGIYVDRVVRGEKYERWIEKRTHRTPGR